MTDTKLQAVKENSKEVAQKAKPKNQLTDEQKARGKAAVNSDFASVRAALSESDDNTVLIGDYGNTAKNQLDFVETTGTEGYKAAGMILKQICNLDMSKDKHDTEAMNESMNMLHGIKPQDNIESMLAAQMVAIHKMAMDCAARALYDGQTFEGRQLNLNSVNKLTKSFVALSSTLDKHRGKGQQKMTVEHVHVNEGGQAIIGSVEQAAAQKVFEDKGE